MDYWEHYNQLRMHTRSQESNNHQDDIHYHYQKNNLAYDKENCMFTIIVSGKLKLKIQFQPEHQQFHVEFYFGYFFKKLVYEFNLKMTPKPTDDMKTYMEEVDTSSKKYNLDYASHRIVEIVNSCPFIYATKKDFKVLSKNGVKNYYHFIKTTMDFSVNNDRDTPVYKCYAADKAGEPDIYHVYDGQLREIHQNKGVDFIDEHMEIKQKLVIIPYFVSKRISHNEWFLIADFSNNCTGFLAHCLGHYIYVLKYGQNSISVAGTDKEFSLNELLSKYSLDYFKQNKRFNAERIDSLFNEFGLDANNLTEKDFEAYRMYEY